MGIEDDILQAICEDLVMQIQHEIVADDLVFKQDLFNSWEIEKVGEGHYRVGSPLVYADVMDQGRLPGKMPPIAALFPWVMDKFSDVRSTEEAKRVAYAVAKTIAEKGIEPRHYIRRALFKMEKGSQ